MGHRSFQKENRGEAKIGELVEHLFKKQLTIIIIIKKIVTANEDM